MVLHQPRTLRVRGARYDHLVFRKRFLDGLREGHVELAARPPGVLAERPDIADDAPNLLRSEEIAERRHDAAEAAHGPSVANHRRPIHLHLGAGGVTVAEVRERHIEPHDALRLSRSVEAVT